MRSSRKYLVLGSLIAGFFGGATLAATDEPSVSWTERERYLMGTSCRARAYGDPKTVGPSLDAALDRIAALEDAMTTWREDGGLARLNRAFAGNRQAPLVVSDDLYRAIEGAIDWARRTEGSFDPTVGALVEAWGLRSGGRRPDDGEIRQALKRTSWRLVRTDAVRGSVSYAAPGVSLDLGGFGKGWALDEAARVLRELGVRSALLNFGGQVLALGAPPGAAGWVVDVAHPTDRMQPVASLLVKDASVATSGNAERSFVVDGRAYGHLLDPVTGRPVERRGSTTVLAATAAAADALATAIAVRGPDVGAAYLSQGATFLYLEPPEVPGERPIATEGPGLSEWLMNDRGIRRGEGSTSPRPTPTRK